MFTLFSDESNEKVAKTNEDWYPSKEVIPTENIVNAAAASLSNVLKISFGDCTLLYLKRDSVLQAISEDKDCDLGIHVAEENDSDLVPAKYEGGLKVWECTRDLATWLQGGLDWEAAEGSSVLDLGCGAGLLGILALLYTSPSVLHFQDYNPGVVRHYTVPNVVLNAGSVKGCRFWSGDWGSFEAECPDDFDLILSSETLYDPGSQAKLLSLLLKKLKPTGAAYFASKSYYFGVGGSTRQFAELIEKDKKLVCTTVWRSKQGVQREILEIRWPR